MYYNAANKQIKLYLEFELNEFIPFDSKIFDLLNKKDPKITNKVNKLSHFLDDEFNKLNDLKPTIKEIVGSYYKTKIFEIVEKDLPFEISDIIKMKVEKFDSLSQELSSPTALIKLYMKNRKDTDPIYINSYWLLSDFSEEYANGNKPTFGYSEFDREYRLDIDFKKENT